MQIKIVVCSDMMAYVTAAIYARPEAHPDPKQRWIEALVAGIFYVLFGLLATAATALFIKRRAMLALAR